MKQLYILTAPAYTVELASARCENLGVIPASRANDAIDERRELRLVYTRLPRRNG